MIQDLKLMIASALLTVVGRWSSETKDIVDSEIQRVFFSDRHGVSPQTGKGLPEEVYYHSWFSDFITRTKTLIESPFEALLLSRPGFAWKPLSGGSLAVCS